VRTSNAYDRAAPCFGPPREGILPGGLGGVRGIYMPVPRPTIMSSRSVGVNPYTSVAPVRGGEEPGRLGTANGEGGDLPYWLGWGGRSPPVKVVSCSGRSAKPVKAQVDVCV